MFRGSFSVQWASFSEGWVGRPLGSVGSMVPLGVDMYEYLETQGFLGRKVVSNGLSPKGTVFLMDSAQMGQPV